MTSSRDQDHSDRQMLGNKKTLGHTGSTTAWEVLGIRPYNQLAGSLCDKVAGLRKGNGRHIIVITDIGSSGVDICFNIP